MKCSETKKELYFYIKDDIETGKKTEIENHLKDCSACRNLLNGFSRTIRTVDENPVNYPVKNWDYFAPEILRGVYEKKKFIFWKPALAFALSFFFFVASYIYHQKNLQKNVVSSDTEELVAYLSNFDIPELYQR